MAVRRRSGTARTSGRSGSNLPREYALPGRGKGRRRPRFYRLLTTDLRRYGGAPPEAKPCPRRDCNCRLRRQGVSHAAACGDAPLPGRGGCRRPAAGGDLHAAACRTRPSRGEGQKGIGHQGFLSPLATPQLSFAPLSVASRRSGGREGYGTPRTVR